MLICSSLAPSCNPTLSFHCTTIVNSASLSIHELSTIWRLVLSHCPEVLLVWLSSVLFVSLTHTLNLLPCSLRFSLSHCLKFSLSHCLRFSLSRCLTLSTFCLIVLPPPPPPPPLLCKQQLRPYGRRHTANICAYIIDITISISPMTASS